MLSDRGEEAVAPRVPPVLAKPTLAEQDQHYASGHAAYRSWCEHCVKGRGCASPHVVFPMESCLKLESTMPIWDRKDPKCRIWCASTNARCVWLRHRCTL